MRSRRPRAAQLDLPGTARRARCERRSSRTCPHTTPTLAGEATSSEAGVRFSALYKPSAADTTSPLTGVRRPGRARRSRSRVRYATASRDDVRVRSGNLDLGARGAVALSGTLAAPRLKGALRFDRRTIAYFDAAFRLVDGFVTFAPSDGIVPRWTRARRRTSIDPDPAARDYSSSTDITMNVSGWRRRARRSPSIPVPQYDQQQILGLLLRAPTIGATCSRRPAGYNASSIRPSNRRSRRARRAPT